MKLYANCKHCESSFLINFKATNRNELNKSFIGKDLKCRKCDQTATYQIEEIYAKSGITLALLTTGLAISIFTTIALIIENYLEKIKIDNESRFIMIILITVAVLFVMRRNEIKRINNFNESKY